MSEKIINTKTDGVLEIILNNPAKMNCIGFQMLRELEATIQQAETDKSIGVFVFKGAGDRAFSTGADLKEFQSLNQEQAGEWIEMGNNVFNKIESLSKPTIAFIDGYAMGGGLELALSCDFRVGTEKAILYSPELQHGWLPGWGGMTRLRRLIGEVKAKELVILCERIDAAKAFTLGLLTRIETSESTELEKLVAYLKSLNPVSYKLAKMALQDPSRTTYGTDLQFDVLAISKSR